MSTSLRFALKWTTVAASAVLIGACASSRFASENQKREPASMQDQISQTLEGDLDEQKLEKYFENLMSSQDPAVDVLDSVKRIVKIFYRSERQLRAFDAELDAQVKRASISSFKSYPRLLAYWEIRERSKHKLAYVYDRLLEIRASSSRGSVAYQKAHHVLNSLAKYVASAQGADRLALNSLAVDLKPIYEKRVAQVWFSDPFQKATLGGKKSLAQFAKRPDVQEELQARSESVAQSAESNEGFEKEADRISEALNRQFSLIGSDRSPQADGDRFFPSAGSHGSLSGNEYPKNTWSLTFDDGPSSQYSPVVLKNLVERGLQATFFQLAQNVKAYPQISLSTLNAGMEMANHSYSHPQLPKLTDAKLKHEVEDSTSVEVGIWGEVHRPKLFRCPYGAGLTVPRVREMIAKNGYIHVFWNVDTLDWQDRNPESIVARAKKQMALSQGGIILFHDIHPQSAEASRMLMDWMKSQNIRIKTVGEVIEELNHATH